MSLLRDNDQRNDPLRIFGSLAARTRVLLLMNVAQAFFFIAYSDAFEGVRYNFAAFVDEYDVLACCKAFYVTKPFRFASTGASPALSIGWYIYVTSRVTPVTMGLVARRHAKFLRAARMSYAEVATNQLLYLSYSGRTGIGKYLAFFNPIMIADP